MYVYMYTYIWIHIVSYIYIHTHTHTQNILPLDKKLEILSIGQASEGTHTPLALENRFSILII